MTVEYECTVEGCDASFDGRYAFSSFVDHYHAEHPDEYPPKKHEFKEAIS